MKQNLPNSQTVYTLGLIALIGSFFSSGFIGLACGIVGLIKSKNDLNLYHLHQQNYSFESYTNLKNGRTMCIIGLCIGLFAIALISVLLLFTGVFSIFYN
ncbi:MAG: hypothetical protein JST62_01580 [Bacteroidetes bacterium]|nr:hypothetical protein [Bacteroidota bacterium]